MHVAARASLTERAKTAICQQVGRDGESVAAVAREYLDSVHVCRSHSGSWQRHNRLRYRSRVGRPDTGRSRTTVSRRPCDTARTPQLQPTRYMVSSFPSRAAVQNRRP